MATAVAAATRPAKDATTRAPHVLVVPVPIGLATRMGLDRIRLYLERLEEEAAKLHALGGGQLQSTIDIRGTDHNGNTGDVYVGSRRKV